MKCGVTGKIMFKKQTGALQRAKEILEENSNRRYHPNTFRVYHCIYCDSYHLTTKPL